MTNSPKLILVPRSEANEWLTVYQHAKLIRKDEATAEVYGRILQQFTAWVPTLPGYTSPFTPSQLTTTVVESYLTLLKDQGYSVSHRARVKSVLSGFCQWLIEEYGILPRNPTRGLEVQAQELRSPRILSPHQRFALRNLIERQADLRGQAIFALGYWAGCRVSDVAHLLVEHTHVGPKIGWLHVGHKGEKFRDIDLVNAARRPLYLYLQQGGRDRGSSYVFTSQRSARLSEDGIHQWFRTLKAQATRGEWELIADVTFHDLRHDFAHRAREAGWSLEELAYYLGHLTKKGTPAIQTTIRYTQVSRTQVRDKLKLLQD